MFHIFETLINNIVQLKEIITAPKADAITPSGVVDKPSACGAFIITSMKMIQDLGKVLQTPNSKRPFPMAIYECPFCGKHFKASIYHIRDGHTKSCGCISHKMTGEKKATHGLSKHPLYSIWRCMIDRCSNPSHENYKDYGMRGITVCDEWEGDVTAFYHWAIANGYRKGLVLDRENNNGNYTSENCRWTTTNISAENNRLIRKSNKSGYRGVWFRKKKNLKRPWKAIIQWNYVEYKLGYYASAIEAARAYNTFVINHKTNHPLNKI